MFSKKNLLYLASLFLILTCAVSGLFYYALTTPVVTQATGYAYFLRPGTPKKIVLAELSQQGIIHYPFFFYLYTWRHNDTQIKTGEYLFPPGSTLLTIWKQITTGTGLVQHPFTIVPGWTFAQLRQELDTAPGLRHSIAKLDDKQVMTLLGDATHTPEGEFYPDTYYYTRGLSDMTILKRAHHLMQIKLQNAWLARSPGLPYQDPYTALIAASLIEKEAYLNSERPMIAGVLVNRLHKDMLLQIDATVIFGLGTRYTGKIYRRDLQDDNVYNTYKHKGLPPTPIAMPSWFSIEGALHPQQHDFYYYVARGDGSHQFSRSLPEHNAAVQAAKLHTSYFNDGIVRRHMEWLFDHRMQKLSYQTIHNLISVA